MKVSAALSSAIMAGSVMAAAIDSKHNAAPENFRLLSIRPSQEQIHNAWVQASYGSLLLDLHEQRAICKSEHENKNTAVFHLQNQELFLYSDNDSRHQQVYVDRSAMGQGRVRYQYQDIALPRNAEEKGWAINKEGDLEFDGVGILACPGSTGGAWQLWLSTVENPAGNKDCLGIGAKVSAVDKPVSCVYTNALRG
ncbi:hypothetical protein E4U53_007991 [Claviceps sorghi]|nr:hypothetical protein E4U53_007991 [Claviceps sorghi]